MFLKNNRRKKKKRKGFSAILNMEEDFKDFLGTSGEKKKDDRDLRQESDLNKIDGFNSVHNLRDFKVLFDLGDGSFANVCKVEHKKTKKVYARKTVVLDRNELKPKSVVAEMESLFDSECENILKFHFCIVEENVFYMFLEYMNCGSLADVLRLVGKVPEEMIANLAIEVLKGLDYLHIKRKIVHRDLKPGNILLHLEPYGGKICLADFGLAGFKLGMESQKKIKFNSFVGTNIYMSPERLRGEEHSFDCDMWSLAILLLELAVGEFPFEINENSDIFWQMMGKEKMDKLQIDRVVKSFSNEFQEFIHLCLQEDPSKRPNAQELLNTPFIRKASGNENSKKEFFAWIQKCYVPKLQEDRKKRFKEKKKKSRGSASASSSAGGTGKSTDDAKFIE